MYTVRLNSGAGARLPSRKIALSFGRPLAGLVFAATLGAQTPDPDSTLARLRRAEAAIAVLQQQIAEQAESGARTRSGVSIEFFGRVMVGGFGNSRRVNNVDNPQFVLPDTTAGVPVRGVGMSLRQTRLGLAISTDEALGGSFTGDLDVDFHGGQFPSSGGRTFPLIRLRTARGIVRWSHADLLVGQEMPLISGLNPVTPAAVGTPAFATAGNLWLWLPQIRVGVHGAGALRWGLQGAVLAPTSGTPVLSFTTDYDLAERSQRPFLQARAHVSWGEGSGGDVGCGVHQGWLMSGASRVTSRAVGCDAIVPLAETIEVRGEFYTGKALAGLGGGGIGQNFTAANEPLESTGGWMQLVLRPTAGISLGAGCGADHSVDAPSRSRNDSCAVHAQLRPAGPLFLGAELRRLRTGYPTAMFTSDHVTLATGFEF